jgi:hypothetical protein
MRKLLLYCGTAVAVTLATIGAAAYVTANPQRSVSTIEVSDEWEAPKPQVTDHVECEPGELISSMISEFAVSRRADGDLEFADGGGEPTAEAAVDKFMRDHPGAASYTRVLISEGLYGFTLDGESDLQLVVGVLRLGDRHVVSYSEACSGHTPEIRR